jgi:transcriptional regulator with XRE-family HTH domain
MADLEESGERLVAFGRWLARERELRGLAREEVGRAMKVTSGVVETLESGDAARMPPRAYAVGWLRAYAAAVGLDADEVVLRFEEARGGPAARAGGARPGPASPRVVLAVVLALAVAGAGLWALLGS